MSSQSQEDVVLANRHRKRIMNIFEESDDDVTTSTAAESARLSAKQLALDESNSGGDNSEDESTQFSGKNKPFIPTLSGSSNSGKGKRKKDDGKKLNKKKLKRAAASDDEEAEPTSSQELFASQPRQEEEQHEVLSQDHDDDEEENEDEGEGEWLNDIEEEEEPDEEPNAEDLEFVDDNPVPEEQDVPQRLVLPRDRTAEGEILIPESLEESQKLLLQYLVAKNDPIQEWRMRKQRLNPVQPKPEDRIEPYNHTIVLGPGGSGKTYNIMWLINWLTLNNIPFLVTGTTGNAANVFNMQLAAEANKQDNIIPDITNAKKCQATTMHKALFMAPLVQAGIEAAKCRKDVKKFKSGTRERAEAERQLQLALLKLDRAGNAVLASKSIEKLKTKFFKGKGVIIIDEASMLDERALVFLEKLMVKLRHVGYGPSLLLVGDFYQLPPVDGTPIYESPLMKKMFGTRVIYLDHIFRSSGDDELTKHNRNIRTGDFTQETFDFLLKHDYDDTSLLPPECENCVVIAAKNKVCDDINDSQHYDLVAAGNEEKQLTPRPVASEAKKGIVGALYKKALARAMNSVQEFKGIKLCKGERVILCANLSLSNGLTLGMTGTIDSFVVEKGIVTGVKVWFDGHEKAKKPKLVGAYKVTESAGDEEGRVVSATVWYIPLKRGRAVTINHVEGQTIHSSHVAIFCSYYNNLTGMYEQVLFDDLIRQLYVATSRICDSAQLHLIGFAKLDYLHLFNDAAKERSFGKLREWQDWVAETKEEYKNRDQAREAEEALAQQEEFDAAKDRIEALTNPPRRPMPNFSTLFPMAEMFRILRKDEVICPKPKRPRDSDSSGDDLDDSDSD